MLRQDRFLIGILIGLGILAAAAVLAVVAQSSRVTYLDDSSPSGVVHNYLLALQRGETDRAYAYLADFPTRPSRSEFRSSYAVTGAPTSLAWLQIGETRLEDGEAIVDLTVTTGSGSIFFLDTSYDYEATARLLEEDGRWRLAEMPMEWWDFSWSAEDPSLYPGLAPID